MSLDKKIINEVNRRLQEVRFINPWDSLKESFVVVEEMIKEGIMQKYALAGAIGAMCYIEPFDTRDADFIIEFPEGRIDVLGPLFDFLVSRGYQEFSSTKRTFSCPPTGPTFFRKDSNRRRDAKAIRVLSFVSRTT